MSITFVVGAGASKDLNGAFPVGSELAQSIENLLNGESAPGSHGPLSLAIMRSAGGLRDEHIEAMKRIRDSILSEDSIDDFLSAWREIPFIDQVAKLAIASLILDAERRSALFIEAVSDAERTARLRQFNSTWLGRIVRRPGVSRRDLASALRGISFVVFNYDRLLEQYIKLYSRHVLAKTETEADALLNHLSIAHAYGSLGAISEQMPVQFGAPDLFIQMAANGIRTYNEDHPSENVHKIREIVESSDKVVFLGCAYHEQNLELLFGPQPRNDHAIFGTCVGLSDRRRDAVIKRLSKVGSVVAFEHNPCSDLLQRFDDEIFSV